MSLNDTDLTALLGETRVIAVVGLSPNTDRPSYRVAAYLKAAGYRIIPVRPATSEVLGETCYPSLSAIPADIQVDIVDLFRRGEETPPLVKEAARIGAKAVWLQSGITHPDSRRLAAEHGLQYVEDRCLMVEHRRLLG